MTDENTPEKQDNSSSSQSQSHPLNPSRLPRGWFIGIGIFILILGFVAIVFPAFGTLTATIFIGWLLVFAGILQTLHAFKTQQGGHAFWQVIIGILSLIAGSFLIFEPIEGAYAVTLVLAFYFIFVGITRTSIGYKLRPAHGSGWITTSGIIDIILAILICIFWPSDALWVPGLIVGIDFIFSGWSMIMLGNMPSSFIADLVNIPPPPNNKN